MNFEGNALYYKLFAFVLIMALIPQLFAKSRGYKAYERRNEDALQYLCNTQTQNVNSLMELRNLMFHDVYNLQQRMLDLNGKTYRLEVQLNALENLLLERRVLQFLPYKERMPVGQGSATMPQTERDEVIDQQTGRYDIWADDS